MIREGLAGFSATGRRIGSAAFSLSAGRGVPLERIESTLGSNCPDGSTRRRKQHENRHYEAETSSAQR